MLPTLFTVRAAMMNKFSGVITVSLEKRYNKVSIKATNNKTVIRLPYDESKYLSENVNIAARTLATNCGIISQDYFVLSQDDSTLFITPDTLTKITF